MAYRHITVTPVSPHIGAEIGNIDLTKPLDEVVVSEVKEAWAKHQVIFFRDQKISFDDHVRLGQYFGLPGEHVGGKTSSKPTDNPLVRKFHYDDTTKQIAGENFHSDQSGAPWPPMASILYNHTLPPNGGGDTMFASMYAAYDNLSPRMKQYLLGLTALHDCGRIFGPGVPSASHPVIAKHPVTGKNLIFVNVDFTSHIEGIPRKESDAILRFLYEHCIRAEWTCRFHWQPHSIALWDNRCVQHKAVWDYWPAVRSGYRIQIEGVEAPIPADTL
jgi:taurine dioxygenase